MGVKRRDFLKIAGVSAAALSAIPAVNMLSGGANSATAAEQEATLAKGTRWGMVIDMRKLTREDCEAAIEACHKVHNVPDIRWPDGSVNHKEQIKWIWEEEYENTFPDEYDEFLDQRSLQSEFLLLCNHCTNPPCVRVCPTKATFKSEKNGIVVMDMHRCIGCRFCMAACPYGSRSFNFGDPRPWIKEVNPAYPTRTKVWWRSATSVLNVCSKEYRRLVWKPVNQEPWCLEICQCQIPQSGNYWPRITPYAVNRAWARVPMFTT